MTIDWLAIRNDYINGGGSYRKLAEKYGTNKDTIAKRAKAENWRAQKDTHTDKIHTQTIQKTEEKISDALSDQAATRARIAAKVTRMVEGWIDKYAEAAEDTGDIRRIVQSCVDMGIFGSKPDQGGEKSNNLLDAIKATEEINTDDLPEVE